MRLHKSTERNSKSNWYALHTRSRCEKKFNRTLVRNQVTTFLPLIKEKRQWSDRKKTIEVPLLPGYLFVHMPTKELSIMYNYPWMVNFVMNEGRPAVIRDEEISALDYSIKNDLKIYPIMRYDIGDRVSIKSGPFKGMSGRITEKRNGYKLILRLESIDQHFCIELSSRHLC